MRTHYTFALLCLLAPGLAAQAGVSSHGHARTREMTELGRLPGPADVVVADIVDYHRHRLPPPRAGEDLALDLRAETLDGGRIVLQVGYTTAPSGDRGDVPPVHLALVLDCSGSMQAHGKMDALKAALRTFGDRLRPDDRVTLVTYNDEARVVEPGRRVGTEGWLGRAIERLEPGGATNLHGGLMAGLRALADDEGYRNRRVILLTDGIANRGEVDPERILAEAHDYTEAGIDLTTIGLGLDLNTRLLERLARGARGLFHFVADAKDIDKVFRKESDSLLCPVARRPRLQVQLPPGLHLERAYGYRVAARHDGFAVALPDLNREVTAVVIVTLQRDWEGPAGGRVRARIDYRDAATDEDRTARSALDLRFEPGRRERMTDPELRKNFTIAVLAQSMHEMAVAAERSCWVDADRSLRRGLDFAHRQFPDPDDADYKRVLDMAEDCRRMLAPRLDRFRDL